MMSSIRFESLQTYPSLISCPGGQCPFPQNMSPACLDLPADIFSGSWSRNWPHMQSLKPLRKDRRRTGFFVPCVKQAEWLIGSNLWHVESVRTESQVKPENMSEEIPEVGSMWRGLLGAGLSPRCPYLPVLPTQARVPVRGGDWQ